MPTIKAKHLNIFLSSDWLQKDVLAATKLGVTDPTVCSPCLKQSFPFVRHELESMKSTEKGSCSNKNMLASLLPSRRNSPSHSLSTAVLCCRSNFSSKSIFPNLALGRQTFLFSTETYWCQWVFRASLSFLIKLKLYSLKVKTVCQQTLIFHLLSAHLVISKA